MRLARPTILTIVGARPQFIKAAIVSMALARAGLQERLLHTGQHFDYHMSEVFFKELGLAPPDWHLDISGLSHGAMTGRMLEAIESVLLKAKPDWLMVYGDTNSTLAGALAAAKLHIPIAHIEAGMRSFNRAMPEELNRVLTDHVSKLLFVTGKEPARLLAQEGIREGVHIVGDVMYDAVLHFAPLARRSGYRKGLGLEPKGYALVTLHRQENTDQPERLENIIQALRQLSRRMPLLLPLHPRTRQKLAEQNLSLEGLHVIEPLGYLEMLALQSEAALILTDSGGLQKEAFYLGVPCITLRDETEWTETVSSGWNQLVGADPEKISAAATVFLTATPLPVDNPYGQGQAADQIARLLAAQS